MTSEFAISAKKTLNSIAPKFAETSAAVAAYSPLQLNRIPIWA
jgi:hypothetical protein